MPWHQNLASAHVPVSLCIAYFFNNEMPLFQYSARVYVCDYLTNDPAWLYAQYYKGNHPSRYSIGLLQESSFPNDWQIYRTELTRGHR